MTEPPRILALDVATKMGVADGCVGEKPVFYTKKFAGEEHEEIFADALRWIAEYLQVNKPDIVAIEAPLNLAATMGQSNPATVVRLNGLWAVIASAVKVKGGIIYRHVNVQTARRAFIGSGNLPGAEAKRRVFNMCKAIGWEPKDKDQGDAGCVHFWASTQFAPNLAPVITPMLQQRIATTIGNQEVTDIFAKKPRTAPASKTQEHIDRHAARALFEKGGKF